MSRLLIRIWESLEPSQARSLVGKVFQTVLIVLILANGVAAVVGTVQYVAQRWEWELYLFECVSVALFTVEYLARVWACTADPRYASPLWGRVRFVFTPLALVDLAAILPFYLTALTADLRMLRLLRLFRLFRTAKLARYTTAVDTFVAVFREKKEEMGLAFTVMLFLILFAASAIYFAEHQVQPDKFPDIPSAMWWAIVTLTTVGYGDVYPVTAAGKSVAAVVAVLGIAMFALPAGILGAGFTEEVQRRRRAQPRRCPHCGHVLD